MAKATHTRAATKTAPRLAPRQLTYVFYNDLDSEEKKLYNQLPDIKKFQFTVDYKRAINYDIYLQLVAKK